MGGVGVKNIPFVFVLLVHYVTMGNSNYRAVRSNQPEDFVVPEMA